MSTLAEVRRAVVSDVARMLGRSPAGFSLPSDTDDIAELTATSASVPLRIYGQTAAERAAVRPASLCGWYLFRRGLTLFVIVQVLQVLAANQLRQAAAALQVERLYAQRCRDESGGTCSAAAAGPRSLLALVALVALLALALPVVLA